MKKQKIFFIIIFAAVAVSGLLFSFYCKSKIASMKSLRTSIEAIQGSTLRVERESGDIEILSKLFPEKASITEFIEDIYEISKQRTIKNLFFEQKNQEFIELSSGKILKALPAMGEKPKVLSSFPVKITFHSGYRNMAEFVREIQNQERLVMLKSFKAKRDKGYLSVEMVVDIYSTEESNARE
jgi:Tfp pilus assembly protein PilO